MQITENIMQYIQAGYSAFYLQTTDVVYTEQLIGHIAEKLNFTIYELNLSEGKIDFKNKAHSAVALQNFEQALSQLLNNDIERHLIFVKNAKLVFKNNAIIVSRFQYLIEKIDRYFQGKCAIIFQSAEHFIPADLMPFITTLALPRLQETEIAQLIAQRAPNLSYLSTALSGLNTTEINKLLNLIQLRFVHSTEESCSSFILDMVKQQKEQIIIKNNLLELVDNTTTINDVGGLDNIKKWLYQQQLILSQLEQALAFGLKAPKGALIAGMPDCGKSLMAKAAASLFNLPLLRLNISVLLGQSISESEINLRNAFTIAENISPCVLWVDELEKTFINDHHSCLLNHFLAWLQEKNKPVFVIATANDITALPAELLRKGRFDEIFYVGFPNQNERKAIMTIHLNKAKQSLNQLNINELAKLCRDYSGADIQNAVYEAVKEAFLAKDKKLTQEILIQAIKKIIPLRKTLTEQVNKYEKKFDALYLTPASINEGLSIAQMMKMSKDPHYLERKIVAENEDVTEEILETLVNDEHIEVRKAAFANPLCPTHLLDRQIALKEWDKSFDSELLPILTQHKNITFDLAIRYCKNNNVYIANLLKNVDITDQNIQNILCKETEITQILINQDLDKMIRKSLALNPYLRLELQILLAQDEDAEVRKYLVCNPHLYQKTQVILARDVDNFVRESLAEYPNLFKEAQIILAQDYSEDVKRKLSRHPNLCLEAKELLKNNAILAKK